MPLTAITWSKHVAVKSQREAKVSDNWSLVYTKTLHNIYSNSVKVSNINLQFDNYRFALVWQSVELIDIML